MVGPDSGVLLPTPVSWNRRFWTDSTPLPGDNYPERPLTLIDALYTAMRLQHLKQIGDGLVADNPARGGEGGDCDRGRAIALADLEWENEERTEKNAMPRYSP
jgi:hypothetical protein